MDFTTRAVCASVSRIEGSVMDQLLAIRNELCTPEARIQAHFALLYTSGWFVLWIEGSEAAVDAGLQRAASDPRNEHQKMLHRSRGPAGLRDRVVVASTQTPMRPTQFARWVMHMKDEGAMLEPVDIWNRLGAPCLIDASRRPCTRPLRQFAFVCADDHGPVEQLRKLGERFASPVVYQRFGLAHSHSPDLGMAYVDVPVQGGAVRIRLLSRRASSHAAMRNSLGGVDGIVLLAGARPAPAAELAGVVLDAMRSAARQPFVWVSAEVDDATTACSAPLERAGIALHKLPAQSGRVDLASFFPAIGVQPQGNSVHASGAVPARAQRRTDRHAA